MIENVDHPKHYTSHPSGIECIEVTEWHSFCVGNAIKYLWRADEKGHAIEDLEKAAWYVNREIERRRNLEAEKQATEVATAQPRWQAQWPEPVIKPDEFKFAR